MKGLTRLPGTRYPVLVPNLTGYERAVAAGATEIAVFAAASESFSQRNTNCSIAESMTRLEAVVAQAKSDAIRVRAYVSCVLGCPYEGEIEAAAVTAVCARLMEMGCAEVSLGDTIGVGTPAVANALVKSRQFGCSRRTIGGAFSRHLRPGAGQYPRLPGRGCTYHRFIRMPAWADAHMPNGASGNVASEDVVYMLHGLGLETGIDLDELANTGAWISKQLQRPNNSRAGLALNQSK